MIPVPDTNRPFVSKLNRIISPWLQFLQQFTQAPPEFLNVIPDGSPFGYTAVEPGVVAITGGTISAITLTRGVDTINVTGTKLIPVSIADTVEVTYSVLPSFIFIPSYGQRTG